MKKRQLKKELNKMLNNRLLLGFIDEEKKCPIYVSLTDRFRKKYGEKLFKRMRDL